MPRQIEVQSADGSTWEVWNSPVEPQHYPWCYPWRYVCWVLEYFDRHGRQWEACSNQSLTVDDAKPHYATDLRLRPYDDAESATQQRRRERLVASGHLQAEQHGYWSLQAERQKQHAGRPQRPADASVAPESPESRAALVSTLRLAQQRANALADTCGTLRTELDEAYAKIGRLTREVERLGRKKR